MYLTSETARSKFPRAYIGVGATIGAGAYIGARAYIEARATISTVCSKYTGNIIPYTDRIDIRIGCEIHAPEVWRKKGAALARKHKESKWWKDTGKNMIRFLLNEVATYERDYRGEEGGE